MNGTAPEVKGSIQVDNSTATSRNRFTDSADLVMIVYLTQTNPVHNCEQDLFVCEEHVNSIYVSLFWQKNFSFAANPKSIILI